MAGEAGNRSATDRILNLMREDRQGDAAITEVKPMGMNKEGGPNIMDAITLLRKQLILSNSCLEKVQALKEALLHSRGVEITRAVQALEPAMGDYGRLEIEQRSFLQKTGSPRLSTFVASQPDSVERDVAFRLVDKVTAIGRQLREEIAISQELMQRSKEYIDFHVNLMSGVRAGTIYSAPGGPGRNGGRDREIFDSSV